MFAQKNNVVILLAIFAVFVILHVPALDHPYHQDEYKWPIIVNPALTEPGGIPHPPVGEFIYRQAGFLVGYDNFRYVPFFFGILNFFLLFYLVKNIFDTKTALWSVGIFTFSFYSLLASLMVDTDGAIMPFFALLSFIFYFKWKKDWRKVFLIPLILAITLGFLVKVSFALVPMAIIIDFAFQKNIFSDRKKILKYFLYGLGVIVGLIIILFLIKFIFPYFRLEWTLSYWRKFVNFGNRGWLQIFIQSVKSVLYLSPLLVLPVFFTDKEIFKKLRPFFLFIFLGLFFYLIVFDFSEGALDRYFQFMVIPLCVIAGAVFAKMTSPLAPLLAKERGKRMKFFWGEVAFPILLSVTIFSLQFFNHYLPALHPKSEWVSRILSFKWNFLYPFSGGSGPLGFYVSFAFMGLFWIFAVVLLLSYFKNKNLKAQVLVGFLVVGLFYNGVFIEEYLFGKINGSTPALVRSTTAFIRDNPDIQKVVVYNDNGGHEIRKTGKYARRLYATPQFEETYKKFFADFSGHVLYIDIPQIGDDTFYAEYLRSCEIIDEKKDKYINSKILDCTKSL